MLISLEGEESLLAQLEEQIRKPVTINFKIQQPGGERDYSLSAQIVRSCSVGIGIAFTKPCSGAITALYSQFKQRSQKSPGAVANRINLKLDRANIEERCKSQAGHSLRSMLEKFFQRVEHELVMAAQYAENNQLCNLFFEAIPHLKKHRKYIEERFHGSLVEGWEQLRHPKPAEPIPTQDSGRLSLLAKDEFEDWLTISDIIAKIESGEAEILGDLEQKIAFLTGCPVDNNNNPVGPKMICEAFSSELESLDLEHEVKLRIYQIFGESLLPLLKMLFTDLETILEPVSIQPDQDSQRQQSAIDPVADEQIDPDKKNGEEIDTDPNGEGESQDNQAEQVEKLLLDAASESSQTQDGGQLKQPSLVESFNRFKQLGMKPRVPGGNSGPALSNSSGLVAGAIPKSVPECSTRQVVSALLSLKSEPNADALLSQDSQSLQNEILQRVSAPISEQDQNIAEIAADFFDSLAENANLLSAGEKFLDNFRIPILNLAIRQPDFLNHRSHPMCRVLNLLDRIEVATNDRGEFANPELSAIVDDLSQLFARGSDIDTGYFGNITRRLEQVIVPFEKTKTQNIERVREQSEGRQQIVLARRYIHELINDRIANQLIPKLVVKLLDAGWEHLLLLSMLREGKGSRRLQDQIQVIDKLLAWLKESSVGNDGSTADHQECVSFIDEQLAMVCADVYQRQEIVAEINGCLIGSGHPPVKQKPETVLARKWGQDTDEESGDSLPGPLKKHVKHAQEIDVGDWLLFTLKNSQREPLKLVWKGTQPESYVFVNRRGQRKVECRLQQLAKGLKNGTVEKIENLDIPLTDRSVACLIQDMHEKLLHQATRDGQTGLINRKEFIKQLEQVIDFPDANVCDPLLAYFEIDPVRLIENTCGTDALETLLDLVVSRIRRLLAQQDIFSRVGQNVFAILYQEKAPEQGRAACEQLRHTVAQLTFDWEDRHFPLGVSIGVVPCSQPTESVTKILAHADTACLAAKDSGRNQIQVYAEENEDLKFKGKIFEWAGQISNVIAEDRIFARCQLITPITPDENNHCHYEVLLGILDESGQVIVPNEFIPAAEHLGHMPEVDQWMIGHVFDWIEANPDKMATVGGFSINLSGQSLTSETLLEFLKQQLSQRSLSPERITFEITETFAVNSISLANKFISQIKRYGCKFSLDDFGSGFSSYAYLKNLDVDYLKIDGMFVKDIVDNPTDYCMVKSMNEIGHSLGIETIAEYVENDEILAKLKEIGVDYAQGFGIMKPALLKDL